MSKTTYALSSEDSSQYENGYSIFLKRSDFREKVIEKFSVIVSELFPKLEILRVLDVGCGNGLMTKKYVNELKKITPNINLTILEPAGQSLEEARSLLLPEVKNIEVKTKIFKTPQSDLILASYVFYHLSPESLEEMTNNLAPGGFITIMMGTSNHPLKSHPVLKELSAHGSSDNLSPFIENLLATKQFKVLRYPIGTKLNLNGLWDNKQFTEEAKKLLSFSLNKDFDGLPESAIQALKEVFEKSFEIDRGYLEPIHEIILIERLK